MNKLFLIIAASAITIAACNNENRGDEANRPSDPLTEDPGLSSPDASTAEDTTNSTNIRVTGEGASVTHQDTAGNTRVIISNDSAGINLHHSK